MMAMYKEILKLRKMLAEADIPFLNEASLDGYRLAYYVDDSTRWICSVVQNGYSYGGNRDLLEIMGLLTEDEAENNSVLGYLTAEEVFRRISEHWYANTDNSPEPDSAWSSPPISYLFGEFQPHLI